MAYTVRRYLQGSGGNPAVPVNSYVYLRRINPPLDFIYRVSINTNGVGTQLSLLNVDAGARHRTAPLDCITRALD